MTGPAGIINVADGFVKLPPLVIFTVSPSPSTISMPLNRYPADKFDVTFN